MKLYILALALALLVGSAISAEPKIGWDQISGTPLNADDYGVVGDGVTDDYSALNAWATASGAGDVLYLPPGTYSSSEYLSIPSGVTLTGYGSTLKFPLTDGLRLTDVDNVTIQGVTLMGNNSTASKNGIRASSTENITLEDVTIYGFSDRGVYSETGTQDLTLENCKISHNGYNPSDVYAPGIDIRASTGTETKRIKFFANSISHNGGRGININQFNTPNAPHDITVSGCDFTGNQGNVLYISGMYYNTTYMAYNIVVTGNTLTDNEYDGIDISAAKNVAVSGNAVYDAKIDGINLWCCRDFSVTGNTVMNCGGPGIMTQGYNATWLTSYGLIDSNVVTNCNLDDYANMYGIRLHYSQFLKVSNNYVSGSMHDAPIGEDAASGCDYNYIFDNFVTGAVNNDIVTIGAHDNLRATYPSGYTYIGISGTEPKAVIQSAGGVAMIDGMTAPSAITGYTQIYVDTSDGDLKVRFGDGTIKTIVVDT